MGSHYPDSLGAVLAPLLFLVSLTSAAQELSLADAQAAALRAAPSLLAQAAAVKAARATALSAGQLPDPKLIAAVENVPIEGEEKFSLTRDFMTMRKVGVMQDVPRAEKRRLREQRAEAEVRREEAMLAVGEVNLRREVALAWVEAWSAQQRITLLGNLDREARLAQLTADAALAGGKESAAAPFSARLATEQLADRLIEARRLAARGREQMARWIGRDAERPLGPPPDFTRLSHDQDVVLRDLEVHPHLALYGPLEEIADTDVRLAEAAKRPDWSLEVAYAQRGPTYSNMVTIGVRVDLPIFEARRQAPAIESRLAAAQQVRAQAEDARRGHLAEVRVLLTDWRAAQERARRIETVQIPLATARIDALLAAYRGGNSDLGPVLESRRMEIDIRLAQLDAIVEMARAWAQVNFLLPEGRHKEKP